MYVLIRIICKISFCLIKSSYTERKKVQKSFLKEVNFYFFFRFPRQFCYKIQSQVLWMLHWRFVCLKYKGKFCASYTAEIHLLEIERQILWLLEIHLFEFKVVFCHLWLQSSTFWTKKNVFYELWLAQRNFLAICNY